jgi:prepilin-type N-terminal cleavage/methylation domain-containing protein/prepilin-type processing-associated H-X9-DG protein
MKLHRIQQGFTLIELLVVVAIISVLAGILFPVFARARENARRASCMSNLKQLGLGMMMYVQDNDETFPMATYLKDGANFYWWQMLQPYTKNVQINECPSSPFASVHGYETGTRGDYGANSKLVAFPDPPVIPLASVQSSAATYLFLDFGYFAARYSSAGFNPGSDWNYLPGMGDAGGGCGASVNSTSATGRMPDCMSGRHFGGVNVAFADGHVKWLKSRTVVQEAKNWPNSDWNPQASG